MRYELMRPHQIRDAVARNLPVILPLGVMEYHGEHLPVGMDSLAVTRALDRLTGGVLVGFGVRLAASSGP